MVSTAPNDYGTGSYWLGHIPYAPSQPLRGDITVDLAIIGGGFTGLWTAIAVRQAEPACSVAVLERDIVGYGASGRTGGFAITLVDRSLTHLVRHVGREAARAIHTAVAEVVRDLKPFCDRHGIDCDAMPNGLLVASNGPEQDARIEEEVATLTTLGIPGIRYLDRRAVQEEIHSEVLRCGFEDSTCTLVDPAKLVRGLKDLAVRLGADVFEETCANSIEHADRGVVISTNRGTVRADRAVLTLNAYSRALPQLRRYLMNFYTYVVLTEPLTDAQWARIGWHKRQGLEDRRTCLHYPRPTIDGRILWGGRNTPVRSDGPHPKYDRDEEIFRRLEESFRWMFPQLADVRFTHRWGGPLAITGRFMPAVGWLKGERIAYGFGYNGHGVGPSRLVGEILADLLSGRGSERSDLAFVRTKPLAMPGGRLRDLFVGSLMKAMIRADDNARPPSLPVRLLDRALG